MSYQDIVRADQRLSLLQALAEDPDYSHNEHVLAALLQSLGHGVSRDQLRTELSWLAEQGLIKLDQAELYVARLTARGEDVAQGRSRVPGVARPRPGG